MSKQFTIEVTDKVYQDLTEKFQEMHPNVSLSSELDGFITDWICSTVTNTARNFAKQKALEEFENQYLRE